MANRALLLVEPIEPDPLEIEAEQEIDLLQRAADYLTDQLRGRCVHGSRLAAIVKERQSIEWECWQLECALLTFRSHLDAERAKQHGNL